MSSAQEFVFQLPLGLLREGRLEKEVALRMMTGNDRVLIANPKYRKNSGELITALLKSCIIRIGEKSPSTSEILNLTTGDRDFCLFMLRKISLDDGDIIHAQMQCSACKEQLQVEVNVDSIPIKKPEASRFEIEEDSFLFTLENKKHGLKIKMKLSTGAEQEKISPLLSTNPIAAGYRMYELCIKEWNGEKNILSMVKMQPAKILDWLDKEYQEMMPGPDWRQEVICDVCGGSTLVSLSNSDFFIPTQR